MHLHLLTADLQKSFTVRELLHNFKSLNRLMATCRQNFQQLRLTLQGLHAQKKRGTSSCLKKITGEAMSLRWQSSTMCSSSLSSCCTSWTWCSFQPCPVGNQPAFSLAVCLCVRVWCCRAMLSQAFSGADSQSEGLQRGLATETLCGMLGWMLPWFSTRMPPMQPLQHVCWTVLGCQEGATFCISCSTSPLYFLPLSSFLSFFLCVNKAKCPQTSHFLFPVSLLYFLSPFLTSPYLRSHLNYTNIIILICHTVSHTYTLALYISYPPVVNKQGT